MSNWPGLLMVKQGATNLRVGVFWKLSCLIWSFLLLSCFVALSSHTALVLTSFIKWSCLICMPQSRKWTQTNSFLLLNYYYYFFFTPMIHYCDVLSLLLWYCNRLHSLLASIILEIKPRGHCKSSQPLLCCCSVMSNYLSQPTKLLYKWDIGDCCIIWLTSLLCSLCSLG